MTAPSLATDGGLRSAAKRWMLPGLLVAGLILFLVANRGAYKGYFFDDDLDTMGWATIIGNESFVQGLITPQFYESNFRPFGALYYRFLGRTFDLRYPPYVAVLQTLHVLNVILLFFLLRRLQFSQAAALCGALFYSFHAAVLEAYWKPMYVFDLLCATLCLVTLLAYLGGHWILALIPFWLAYKSKELAVMLPIAVLAIEVLVGDRKWKRLIPYFLISLNFGIQALVHNLGVGAQNPYALHFSPELLWASLTFYSSAILFLPFAGFALLAVPLFVRDRRAYIGLIFMVAMMLPLIALPGRTFSVYWYVPLIGLAIMFSAVASRLPVWSMVVFFLLWLPFNYLQLREKRREILSVADEVRWLVAGLQDFARGMPALKVVVYDSLPPHVHRWGMEGAIHHTFGPKVKAVWFLDDDGKAAMNETPMAIVRYEAVPHRVRGMLRMPGAFQSKVRFTEIAPDWQFGPGWFEGTEYRWTSPRAEITLRRPEQASSFEIEAVVPPRNLRQEGPSKVTLYEDGRDLGSQTLADSERKVLRWMLPEAAPGNKKITIVSDPVRHGPGDMRDYGIVVTALGYVSP